MRTNTVKDAYVDCLQIGVPFELRARDQWVLFNLETDSDGKQTKVPYNVHTGGLASHSDPRTWAPFDMAVEVYQEGNYDLIGYALSEDDPYTGTDLDKGVVDGVISTDHAEIMRRINSYSEFSQSGTGVHIIAEAELPGRGRKHPKRKIEIYDRKRFFVFTGNHVPGMPDDIQPRQAEIEALYHELFPQPEAPQVPTTPQTTTSAEDVSDDELIQRMFAGVNGEKIRRLWEGDKSAYPLDAEGKPDDSGADLALCNSLAFWTRKDAARMDRLFRRSKLYRQKWERKDYRDWTINKAIAGTHDVWAGPSIDEALYQEMTDKLGAMSPAHTNGALHITPFSERPHNTDMGNALRMYTFAKDRVMYVPHFGKWFTWKGTHWQEDNNYAVLALAKQTVRRMYGELAGIDNDDKRKEQLKWIVQSESRTRLEAMIALLKSEPGISVAPEALDKAPMLLPVLNGTIDLRTGELLPSDPAHRFTHCVNVAYDPQAECPLWEKFLIRIMNGDLELVSFLQRIVGHALTGDATGKYLIFLYGATGNNGKSTLVEAVFRMLGGYAVKSPTAMVMAKRYQGGVPNDVARLRGARLTVTNEVDSGMTLSENVVKDLTGKDTLTARYMHQEYFDFHPTHKLWMYGNHKPDIRGTDSAIWNRVNLVPFEVEIPAEEQDPHLADKLEQELSGILTWSVIGCLAWQKTGIAPPDKVKVATTAYKSEQDVIGKFLEDCCEIGKGYSVGVGNIYKAYEKWCEDTDNNPESSTSFGKELTRRGYTSKRTAHIRTREGLRMNDKGQELIEAAELIEKLFDGAK